LTWLIAFGIRFSNIPSSWWQYRDDADITLSAARNLTDFGVIGFSPGGPRVEGFSNPLEFILAVVTFTFRSIGYKTFLNGFVILTIGGCGAVVALTIWKICRPHIASRSGACLATWFFTILSVFLLLLSFTASGWMVSGLENPLIVLLGFCVLYFVTRPDASLFNSGATIASVTLLGLTRSDIPFLLVPVVLTVAFNLATQQNQHHPRRVALAAICVPIATWGFEVLIQRIYFGYWTPNTAVVEGKTGNLAGISIVGFVGLSFGIFILSRLLVRRGASLRMVFVICIAASVGICLLLVAGDITQGTISALAHTPYVIALAILILTSYVVLLLMNNENWHCNSVYLAVTLVPLVQFVVVGPARLDPYRIASLAIPFESLWLVVLLVQIFVNLKDVRATNYPLRTIAVVVLVLLVGSNVATTLIAIGPADSPSNLCCLVSANRSIIINEAESNVKPLLASGTYPIVANPDLGEVSFQKKAMIVDLGWLGDPMLYRIFSIGSTPILETYLNDVVLPDVVESHGGWSCYYGNWIDSSQFTKEYRRVYDIPYPALDGCASQDYQIWIRVGGDSEYALARDIASSAHPARVTEGAIGKCSSGRGGVFRCEYVRRAVWRDEQLLKNEGFFANVVKAFRTSPSASMDVPLLEGNAGWDRIAYYAFMKLVS
jgi:hypothetical protein